MASASDTSVASLVEQLKPTSIGVGVVAVVFAVVCGFLAAWGTVTIELSGPAFVLVGLLVGWLLWGKPIALKAIASGLYYSALLLVLVPILFYVPNLTSEPETAEEAGVAIGSALGLVIWGFAFALVALVIAGVGYLVNKRATKHLEGSE